MTHWELTHDANTIDEMSRNSRWDNPADAAEFLVSSIFAEASIAACDHLLSDATWSHDREPHIWLQCVRDIIDDM